MRILVTGTTGYIGGRLVPRLLEAGHELRALARDPEKLRGVPWRDRVEVVKGDVTDADAMTKACDGMDVVYYLVHSLQRSSFESVDRRGALITADAARAAGVGRIVYLGGLRPADGEELSPHLASRNEVGEIFLRSGVPAAVLQAAVILGAGSASFEMLRYLTERLPVMVTPQWVDRRVQPIAVRDVLHYLAGATELPAELNRTFDIGGPEVLTYRQMMQRYATVAELPHRRVLPVPFLTPKLSSHWVNLVTPVPRRLAAPLIESLVWSPASAARTGGTRFRSRGPCAGGSTGWLAAWVCGAGGGTRPSCTPARRWTGGVWRRSTRPARKGCCVSGRRCGSRAGRGWNSRSARDLTVGRFTGSGRSSSPAVSPASSTGGQCGRFTASCSVA